MLDDNETPVSEAPAPAGDIPAAEASPTDAPDPSAAKAR